MYVRNQRQSPLSECTGSNLADMGRVAACAPTKLLGGGLVGAEVVGHEGRGEGLRRTRGGPQGQSWAPDPTTGVW